MIEILYKSVLLIVNILLHQSFFEDSTSHALIQDFQMNRKRMSLLSGKTLFLASRQFDVLDDSEQITGKSLKSEPLSESMLSYFDYFTTCAIDFFQPCDVYVASTKHLKSFIKLVKSDEFQKFPSDLRNESNTTTDFIEDDEVIEPIEKSLLPSSYIQTLLFLNNILLLTEKSNNLKSNEINKILKLIAKEDGFRTMLMAFNDVTNSLKDRFYYDVNLPDEKLWQNTNALATDISSTLKFPSRDIVEMKRKIERIYSSILLVIISYRISIDRKIDQDFIYFLKTLIDCTPSLDRHFALLLYCRGIFPAPSRYNSKSKASKKTDIFGDVIKSNDDTESTIDFQTTVEDPFPRLCQSYKAATREISTYQPSKACRIIFPYMASISRMYDVLLTSVQTASLLSDHPPNEDKKYTSSDAAIFHFFQVCTDIDRHSKDSNGVTDQADDMLSALHRWICDMTSLHFIRDTDEEFSLLPEIVKKNTIAMELLSTHKTFVEGRQKEIDAYTTFMCQIGKILRIILTLTPSTSNPFQYSPLQTNSNSDEDLYNSNLKTSNNELSLNENEYKNKNVKDKPTTISQLMNFTPYDIDFIVNIKKIMAVVSFAKRSPRRKLLAIQIHKYFGLPLPYPSRHPKSLETDRDIAAVWTAEIRRMRIRNVKQSNKRDVGTNDWLDSMTSSTRDIDMNDEDIWASTSRTRRLSGATSKSSPQRSKSNLKTMKLFQFQFSNKLQITQLVNHFLTLVICNIVGANNLLKEWEDETNDDDILYSTREDNTKKIEANKIKADILDEIEYIFSTWRRPHYLIDYYLMHYSSPTVQSTFTCYLKSLFGVTQSRTIDDIRMRDSGNLNHFKYFDPALLEIWMNEETKDGRKLPGYTDPQTLFMIGEDGNTCMSIRSKQKGTNRGLISFLLDGNCRFLGLKDSSGKLLVRSTAKLLVDDLTHIPLLYIESSFGSTSHDQYLEIFDQAAELGELLDLPVVYASPPIPRDVYCMGPREIAATDRSSSFPSNASIDEVIAAMVNVSDYSVIASFICSNGIKNPESNLFIPNRLPRMVRSLRATGEGVVVAARPAGFLENLTVKHWPAYLPPLQAGVNGDDNVVHVDNDDELLKPSSSSSVQGRLFSRQNELNKKNKIKFDERMKNRNIKPDNNNVNVNATISRDKDDDDDLW